MPIVKRQVGDLNEREIWKLENSDKWMIPFYFLEHESPTRFLKSTVRLTCKFTLEQDKEAALSTFVFVFRNVVPNIHSVVYNIV
jgi:hypothetical protein